MLLELAIRDFAIIEATRIEFQAGFNALTGETGAGKSILIDALGAVLGERVGPDVVRTGARAARIEATFDVTGLEARPAVAALFAELGVEPGDGLLIFTREVSANGRSAARLNGRAVTASTLNRLGSLLVDIHGQSDHLSLLRPAEHLEMLDRFAGLGDARLEVARLVGEWREVRTRIDEIVGDARGRAQRADLLRFQVDEIAAAGLRSGEEEELIAERAVLANAERLALDAAAAYGLLAGASAEAGADAEGRAGFLPVLEALRTAGQHLTDIAGIDEAARPQSERLAEIGFLLEDVAAEVRAYRDAIEADPARLGVVEERLDELKGLKRKYGATVAEVIRFGEAAAAELSGYEGAEADVEALQERQAALGREVGERALALSAARAEAGERLSRQVEAAIVDLKMGRSRFAVSLTRTPDPEGVEVAEGSSERRRVRVDQTGVDDVVFLLAANPGEALKPLGRVASGGETARLMLALKSILAEADETPTLVFDEVDVGVGGRSGQVVGEKLWRLAAGHQVVVVTHLPQIAAFAETHFRIAKSERDGRIVSEVTPIERGERIDELAAMLDGTPVTDVARRNAREMLKRVAGAKEARVAVDAVPGRG
ncbi:MAG: DNA repair protein RecN [Chloroflexia bacterium]|nr:DNA repair protein RecN [Chloroflexia bacterium]